MSGILNSSVGRKFAMALSAFFLMIFLVQHFAINILSVFSADTFNEVSHFMGTNWVVQYIAQPILLIGVIFHFVMGLVLEIKNKGSRSIGYVKNNGNANSSWMSRNMIYTGGVIFLFLGLHFYDFWFPEISVKFIDGDMSGLLPNGEFRYYDHLHHKFVDGWRVAIYCLAFVFLALHLLHGFSSAFQSVGANNKYTRGLKGFGKAYAILIPLGFIFIALYLHFN